MGRKQEPRAISPQGREGTLQTFFPSVFPSEFRGVAKLTTRPAVRKALFVDLSYERRDGEHSNRGASDLSKALTELGYTNRVVVDGSQPFPSYEYLVGCLDWLAQNVSTGDKLFFMFSGSYSFHIGPMPHLISADSRQISWADLQGHLIDKVPAGAELVIVLGCHYATKMNKWKYCIGRRGNAHKFEQTNTQTVLSELGLSEGQYIRNNGNLQAQSTVISRAMPVAEVVDLLIQHNCRDITEELDFDKCSPDSFFRGGFGTIHKGALCSGQIVAIKCVEVTGSWGAWTSNETSLKVRLDTLFDCKEIRAHAQHSAHEIYAWSKCSHSNILQLLGFTRYKEHILLVSPWMKNGSLVQYIDQNPRFDRFQPSLELASAVAYLHDVGIVHGDIKSDNVIISDDGHVQLGDFGSASLLEYASVSFTNTGFHGTLRFMAPEILKGEQPTKESDVYALGMVSHPHSFSANHMMNIGVANIDDICTLNRVAEWEKGLTLLRQHMMTGEVPFANLLDRTIPFKVTAQKVQPERPDFPGLFVDQAAKDELWCLLSQCWDYDPENRPTAIGVKESLMGLEQFTIAHRMCTLSSQSQAGRSDTSAVHNINTPCPSSGKAIIGNLFEKVIKCLGIRQVLHSRFLERSVYSKRPELLVMEAEPAIGAE
ncbi:unnamed protein product [Rhizoctonia solani]|uniref:Protein kinase domain-containing protein n=1 Tax=Rhizoctonia solani TaxID=456999 RepID=A0A8H3DAQ7_9AGAM|nr:unnamed protein product [Rhizoctonia solani]CAE6518068.1 unnamed protein product [Rhizoctonia solani]